MWLLIGVSPIKSIPGVVVSGSRDLLERTHGHAYPRHRPRQFKSVTCLYDTGTGEVEFQIIATERHYVGSLLRAIRPDRVVIEACAVTGW